MTDYSQASKKVQRLQQAYEEFRDAMSSQNIDLARALAKEMRQIGQWLDKFYEDALLTD